MKIFGIEIKWKHDTKDKVIVRTVTPATIPVSKIPPVVIRTLSYAQQFSQGRGVFIGAEYDLSEIGKIEDVDSYCRQAFKKKEGLMFKEGVGVKGSSKDTLRYYKTRMAQMSRASGIPEITLLKRTARSLIRTSNAFLVKVRDPSKSGGQVRTAPEGKRLKPIAAYFPAAPETMRADLDENTCKIRKWRQILPDGRYRDFLPEDVVHFMIDRREGFLYGVPTVIPTIDDIRALRQIEENIEVLLYQHIFPLFHYKVGTETAPAGYTEEGDKEVDIVEQQVRLMPSEGAIVTPERHEIKAVGAEGRALRAEGYLDHFKQRVFTGLGVSAVDMGEGDTTNRATANVMSRALVDSVKAIQDDLEAQWDYHVVSELLLESTFGDNVLDEDSMVHLKFEEIDIQNKMDMEKHATSLWEASGLTYDEYRGELNREPIPIPDDPSDQDMSKYPEWAQTHWKLIREVENLIRAVDEPWSAASQAAAEARSSALTQRALGLAQQTKEKEQKVATEEDRKTKVAVVQAKPNNVSKRDHFLSSSFSELEADTAARLRTSIYARGTIDRDYLLSLARLWADNMVFKLHSLAITEFLRGFNEQTGDLASQASILINSSRHAVYDRIQLYITKLVENTIDLVYKRVDAYTENVKLTRVLPDIVNELHIAFDSVRYRADFIWDVELRKAYSFGRLMGMRFLDQYAMELHAHSDSCEKCKIMDKRLVLPSLSTIDDVPPFHPNSRMGFKVIVEYPD